MKERTQTGGQAISGLFTMLLFLVFVYAPFFLFLWEAGYMKTSQNAVMKIFQVQRL